jgi:hypothetical protein
LVLVCVAACTPVAIPTPIGSTTASARAGGSESMSARVEVELDIFSGKPNPTWVLTNEEADSFVKKLAALPQISATELSGNLGYRGFIVQVLQGANTQLIHIQTGVVHISIGATKVYAKDENRELERWLLNTGKPHLKNEIFQMVEHEIR